MMSHSTALFVVLMLAGCGALPQLAEPRQLPPAGTADGEGAAEVQPHVNFRADLNQRFAPFQVYHGDVLAAHEKSEAQDKDIVYRGATESDSADSVDSSDVDVTVVASSKVTPDETIVKDFQNRIGPEDGSLRLDFDFGSSIGDNDGTPGADASSDDGVRAEEGVVGPVSGAVNQEFKSSDRQGRSGILASLNFREQDPQASVRLTRQVCGIRRSAVPDVFTRIVGGSLAEKHEFPWQVSVQWRYSWYNYHVCGGAVLNENWIITAAHCTHQFKPSDMIIIAGVHNIKHREGSEQRRDVDRVAEHWGYNPSTQENDIAMIHVMEPLIIDGMTVSPVCLPPPGQFFTGDCVVSGWGKVAELGQSSDELRKVVVPIITREQCMESYRVIGYTGPISEKMLCAGYNQGAKDACQGDSGGPFVCRGLDNRYTIAGVVSWGVGCARPNVPGVYTQVSRYTTWVSSIVHGRTDVTERRAASVHSSLHLNDFFNISADASDLDDSSAEGQRSDVSSESVQLPSVDAALAAETTANQ